MSARTQGLRDLIDQTIRANLPVALNRQRKFVEFLQFIRAESDLLSPRSFRRAQAGELITERVRALARISLTSSRWIRPIEAWQCDREHTRAAWMNSSIHCFGFCSRNIRYPVS